MPKKRKKETVPRKLPTSIPLPYLSDAKKDECRALYIAGFGATEIHEQTGISLDRIKQWVCRDKWAMLRFDVEEARARKNPPGEHPIIQMVANNEKGSIRKKFLEKSGKMAEADIEHWADKMDPEKRLEHATSIAALNGVHRKNLGLEDDNENGEKGGITLNFLSNTDKPGFVKVIGPDKVKEVEQ